MRGGSGGDAGREDDDAEHPALPLRDQHGAREPHPPGALAQTAERTSSQSGKQSARLGRFMKERDGGVLQQHKFGKPKILCFGVF